MVSTISGNREKPLVSVIIPAWNVEQYISRGIESCLNQSYGNVEVIVVDDGSTDKTLAIVERYAKQDSRVRSFRQEHKGVSAARNIGIKNADGTFMMFMDSDDWLNKDTVEFLLNYYYQYPQYLIGAKSVFIEEGKEGVSPGNEDEEVVPVILHRHEALMHTDQVKYNNASSCYKVFCADIIRSRNIQFDEDVASGEDGLFVFCYLNHVNGMVYINKPVWNCLMRKGSSTRVSYNESFLTSLHAVEKMLEYPREQTDDVECMLKAFIVKKALNLFRRYIDCGNEDKRTVDFIKSYIRKYKKEYYKNTTGKEKIRTAFILFMPFSVYLKLYKIKHHI